MDAVGELPGLDGRRIAGAGAGQGGGLALTVAALAGDRVAAAVPDVPFRRLFRRAAEI
ncbi:acetylxylan esterase [Streptomyces roseus]|uniref:acetylxylan esterase n=1 Tax=Streptomyces roseus TaxID=66430 RepID=UPI0036BFB7A8